MTTKKPMTREEIEDVLTEIIRGPREHGKVSAIRLWLELHREDATAADPFSRFDELAQRRSRAA